MLITLSVTISSRYLWWRYNSTLNIDNSLDVFFGVILIFAETYAWIVLLLGFFQLVWPLERKPLALPEDTSVWPSVDIFIPTYNEPLEIVKTTLLAALDIDWPKNKINVFVLDDGNRPEFKIFANEVGAIKNAGGTTLRVFRGENPEWYDAAVAYNKGPVRNPTWSLSKNLLDKKKVHASEYSSVGLKYDHFIDNNGTIDDLHNKISQLLNLRDAK